ncbi:hypothetical protein [Heyndrickxia camelliae]|uniref:Uncharacterized protein n=1 Tax=Heyndrickxia camelliae TaxID=1707093 RepID=A0A2N3LEB4_9BACI|nr:hypothetical protein [Heyndrickxia camelliae]PKR82887.1 hypothetical protein CWO92_22110 [Heyndrickxia camelliae]
MEDYKSKISDIEDICKLWTGLYMDGNSAMSRVAEIIKTKYKIVENVAFTDNKGNDIFKVDKAMIKISEK